MTGGQRWACSVVQAIAAATAALLVGIPLGIAAGRWTWTSVARAIDVAPDPVIPALAVLAVVGGALVIGAVASGATRVRSRRRSWRRAWEPTVR
jgi:hypothetical protein